MKTTANLFQHEQGVVIFVRSMSRNWKSCQRHVSTFVPKALNANPCAMGKKAKTLYVLNPIDQKGSCEKALQCHWRSDDGELGNYDGCRLYVATNKSPQNWTGRLCWAMKFVILMASTKTHDVSYNRVDRNSFHGKTNSETKGNS